MNGILLAAQIEGITTRKDKTVKIVLGTQELSPLLAGQIFSLQDRIICCYISEKETISQSEKDQVDALDPEFGGKSQSQRLRNVLYILFEKNPRGFTTFDAFYKHHTEQIIENLKKKIDP